MHWIRILGALMPAIAVSFWNYSINERTRLIKADVESVKMEIRRSSEELQRLNAEWVHLSNPDRIACLARLYHDELKLVTITTDVYSSLESIPVFNDVPLPIDSMVASLADVDMKPIYYAPLNRRAPDDGADVGIRSPRDQLETVCS